MNPGLDLSELFFRIVFSYVIGNSDMHLKNFSLIETKSGSQSYVLSAAYDMLKLTLLGAFLAITKGRAITELPSNYKWFGQGRIGPIPFMPIVLISVFIIVYIVWNKTPVGRSLFAVGGNPDAAYVSGIKVDKIRIFAFSVSGLLAGLAGFLLSAYMGAVTSTFGTSYDMNNIAAAVIGGVSLSGGQGTVQGIMGGVLVLTVIQVGLQILGVSSYHVQMINGLIIFVAVLLDAIRLKAKR